MNTRFLGLQTALPPFHATQEHVSRFMARVIEATANASDRDRLLAFVDRIYSRSGIRTRHSVIPDFVTQDPDRFTFFPPRWDLEPFPGTARRMEVYERESVGLALTAARGALDAAGLRGPEVTHLIVCTCTGFFAPGPDVLLVEGLGLRPSVSRSILGYMGCYAGLSGLRLADQICRGDPDAVVLHVCVELCSIHFQKRADLDLLVANSLFADGCAAAVYGGARSGPGIARIESTLARVEGGTRDEMSWRIGDHGFEMRLADTVPRTLRGAVPEFLGEFTGSRGREGIGGWALHPGGRRIVEELRDVIGLESSDVEASFDVLARCGNVSSATIFFVLDRVFARCASGEGVVALGFGPGLTIDGALLRMCT